MSEQERLGLDTVWDFRRARRKAVLQDIFARLRGKSNDLLAYEDVRQKLRAQGQVARGLQDIPLDAIVGSVGRYTDFTRSFLPRNPQDQARWARVMHFATDLAGLPPIEVYQIGQVYFVLDGNHRVSVARQLGATHIQAYVTEIHTRVPLAPTDSPDDIILKAEYVEFLEHTHLDTLYPQADFSVTAPGQYRLIESHIEARRQLMALEQGREVSLPEAIQQWYTEEYLPIIQIIRARGLLRDFPGRTETDLYVWITEHRAALEEELGWQIDPEAAAADLVSQRKPQPERIVARLFDVIRPEAFEAGPPPGAWRRERAASRDDTMFSDILVPVNGDAAAWYALEQAIIIAEREKGRLAGLFVVPSEDQRESEVAKRVQAEFERRCAEANVSGKLAIDVGSPAQQICDRARWTDLVVVKLTYPPGPQPIARLRSGFRALIQRSPQPVLVVPHRNFELRCALLCYDGSPKADEALFMAAYLASRWQASLVVLTVVDGSRTSMHTLERARAYLTAHHVQATYLSESGAVAETILRMAEQHQCDLLITGGYGFTPLLEVAFGSTVDALLRASPLPILVCR